MTEQNQAPERKRKPLYETTSHGLGVKIYPNGRSEYDADVWRGDVYLATYGYPKMGAHSADVLAVFAREAATLANREYPA